MNEKNTGINKFYYLFILFFLISVVFWFMTKLSKEYEGTIKFPVIYNNLPDNKLLQENPLDFIDIHVRAMWLSDAISFASISNTSRAKT